MAFKTAEELDAHIYVLADPAQNIRLPSALQFGSDNAVCLLEGTDEVKAVAPYLIQLPAGDHRQAKDWLDQHASTTPCATLIASPLTQDRLADHLKRFLDVVLPDKTTMALAFWDPSVLATLNGAQDDDTLHVPGPLLTPEQKRAFLEPVLRWWYWNRNSYLRQIDWVQNSVPESMSAIRHPLTLDQQQVDSLVEASVPDNILHFIRLNMSGLLLRIPISAQYNFVQSQILRARQYGIGRTGDLVNYCCVALAYGESFDTHATVAALLDQIKVRDLVFDDLMKQFPRDVPKVGETY